MDNMIKLLEENARYSNHELSVMLGITEEEVAAQIAALEKEGIIKGYKTIVNHEKIKEEYVSALIELRVTPKRGLGFDEIAERIAAYPEVEDVYLMSGGYDLALMISGRSFKDIALFVSQRLAPMDSVISTATHFVLSTYKEKGVQIFGEEKDERSNTWL